MGEASGDGAARVAGRVWRALHAHPVDAAIDTESKLSHSTGEGDSRLLQAGSPTVPIAHERGPRPYGDVSTTATFATRVSLR